MQLLYALSVTFGAGGRRRVGNARDPHRFRVLRLVEDEHVTDGASRGAREAQARIARDGARAFAAADVACSVVACVAHVATGPCVSISVAMVLKNDVAATGAPAACAFASGAFSVTFGAGAGGAGVTIVSIACPCAAPVSMAAHRRRCGRPCSAAGSPWRRPRRPG